jgi:voltage-gated potassium channel
MSMPQLPESDTQIAPKVLVKTVLRMVVTVAILFTAYAFLPLEQATSVGTAFIIAVLAVLVFFSVVYFRQVRRILRSQWPLLAGGEALVMIFTGFILGFAFIYLVISTADPAAFTVPLNRINAVYLTVIILSTVGFGDITPTTSLGQIIVTVQMLAGLTLLATTVRLILGIARRADRRLHSAQPEPDSGEASPSR